MSSSREANSKRFRLNRRKTLVLLDELAPAGDAALSVYVPPETAEDAVALQLEGITAEPPLPPEIAQLAADSPTGAVLFWGPPRRLLIRPPLPITDRFVASGYDVEALRRCLQQKATIATVLVRLGRFAVGAWRGEKLLSSKTSTGLVHGRHRKGGSSQRRFERHRQQQSHDFLDRACGHARDVLEPHLAELDYLVYGGGRDTIRSLRKQCPFLSRLAVPELPPLLAIPDPRRSVLEDAIVEVWSSAVTEWPAAHRAAVTSD